MKKQSSCNSKRSASVFHVELLEQRAYLNGVELGTPITSPIGGLSPASISVTTASGVNADFNGDRKTDLVVYDFTNSKVGLNLGNGDGTFRSPTTAAVQTNSVVGGFGGAFGTNRGPVAISDINGDGKLDIVTGGTGAVTIVRGDGAGGLGAATTIATNVQNNFAIAVVDLNGDGLQDIVAADAFGRPYIPISTPVTTQAVSAEAPTAEALIQQPDGSFVQQNISSTAGLSSMAVGDFNGDGRPDLALTLEPSGAEEGAVEVMLNRGDGTFGSATQYAVGPGVDSLVAADFNGDGKLDLAALGAYGGISFLAANGDGTFKSVVTSSISGVGSFAFPEMTAAPLNSSDSLPDLLINLGGQGVMALNNGDGTFRQGTTVVTGGGTPVAMAAGDLNTGDTLTSIFVADANALTSLLNVTSQDTTPPTASLQTTAVAPGSPTYQFTINFSDDKQIDVSTITADSISVTGPDGTVVPVTLFTRDIVNGPQVQAIYQVTFTGQYYGQYTVTAATSGSAAVRDANANVLANSAIGTFDVNPPIQPPFAPTIKLSGQFPKQAASGTKGPPVKVTVHSEIGFSRMSDSIITLAASQTSTLTSDSIILGQAELHASASAHHITVTFRNWDYPAMPGNYFIVANADRVLPVASSGSAVSVQPATISLDNAWIDSAPSAQHGNIIFSLQMFNKGNAAAKGVLLADLLAASSTSGLVIPIMKKIRVNVAPGDIQVLQQHVAVPKAVPSGTYTLSLSLNPLTGFDGISFTSNTVLLSDSITL